MKNTKLLYILSMVLCFGAANNSFCMKKDSKNEQLIKACMYGNLNKARILIENGADVNQTYNGNTPLSLASQYNYYPIVKLLIEKDAKINKPNDREKTPLYIASKKGYYNIVKLLLKNKADASIIDPLNQTPLHAASKKNHYNIVKLLIQKKTVINTPNYLGQTPLQIAIENDYSNIVKLLIKNKANVNKADNEGNTPLHVASYMEKYPIVKLLIENKANVNKADENNKTPLYVASKKNNYPTTRLLIKNGADVNKATNKGKTPLQAAIKNQNNDIIKLLLYSGAKFNEETSSVNETFKSIFKYQKIKDVKKKIEFFNEIEKKLDKKLDKKESDFYLKLLGTLIILEFCDSIREFLQKKFKSIKGTPFYELYKKYKTNLNSLFKTNINFSNKKKTPDQILREFIIQATKKNDFYFGPLFKKEFLTTKHDFKRSLKQKKDNRKYTDTIIKTES